MRHIFPLIACLLALCHQPVAQVVTPESSAGVVAEQHHSEGQVWLIPRDGGTPTPQPTIQAGIDAASEGDTILLSPGIFQGPGNRGLVVAGKNVSLIGEKGSSSTIVDCDYRARGITFDGASVTNDTVLQGVTILRGQAPPTTNAGGGIATTNHAAPIIEQCRIINCKARVSGGGLDIEQSTTMQAVVRDCLIAGNFTLSGSTNGSAGGIRFQNALVERCTIIGNVTDGRGGGAWALASTPGAIRDCVIAHNRAPHAGGLIAGVYLEISGCTIVDNQTSAGTSAGVFLWSDPDVLITNSIIRGNLDKNGVAGFQVEQGLGSGLSRALITYCNIQGGSSAVFGIALTKPVLNHITDHEPLFVAPEIGDYRLTADSPCIDGGDPEYSSLINEGDLEAQPRSNGTVDLGADEHWPGPSLSLIQPGRAGWQNHIQSSGSEPGDLVFFFAALDVGVTSLAFALCPSLVLGLDQAQFLGGQHSNSVGNAQYGQFVPSSLTGQTLFLQAVAIDAFTSEVGCTTTNVVRFQYP